jgi:hypothetical protein
MALERMRDVILKGSLQPYHNTEFDLVEFRIRTRIPISDDPYFMSKLEALGFHIESKMVNSLIVILPQGWTHTLNKKNGYGAIFDILNRVRIEMPKETKKSKLFRRYDFSVHMATTDHEDKIKSAVTTHILDQGHPIEMMVIEPTEMDGILKDVDYDGEVTLDRVQEAMGVIMNERFPEWTNELAYWNDL